MTTKGISHGIIGGLRPDRPCKNEVVNADLQSNLIIQLIIHHTSLTDRVHYTRNPSKRVHKCVDNFS